MKKNILTESDKKAIISEKERLIIENFAKTFNKIKRVDENELNELSPELRARAHQKASGEAGKHHNPHGGEYNPLKSDRRDYQAHTFGSQINPALEQMANAIAPSIYPELTAKIKKDSNSHTPRVYLTFSDRDEMGDYSKLLAFEITKDGYKPSPSNNIGMPMGASRKIERLIQKIQQEELPSGEMGMDENDGMSQQVAPEVAAEKATDYAKTLYGNSEMDALANKIASDPKAIEQLKQLVISNGVSLNEGENSNAIGMDDVYTLALNFAKKGAGQQQVNEFNAPLDSDTNPNDDSGLEGSAAYAGFFGGGMLGAALSSTIASAIPDITSVYAGEAWVGAIAGVALAVLAVKVYRLMKGGNKQQPPKAPKLPPEQQTQRTANTGDKEKDELINQLIKGPNFGPDDIEHLSKYGPASLRASLEKQNQQRG